MLVVLAALAGALAGCQRGGSSPGTAAAGAASTGGAPAGAATTSATGCPEPIASSTYVRAASAHVEGKAVVVTAHPARRVCGGPDNSHYEVEAATEQLTVTPSANVVLLTTTQSGLGHETVAPTDLPQRLVDDRFGGIFLVHGPLTAVTALEEQYHP